MAYLEQTNLSYRRHQSLLMTLAFNHLILPPTPHHREISDLCMTGTCDHVHPVLD